jgi:hypothetical protein
MKITLTLLIILSLVLIPFTPFSQNTARSTSTPIASVEYLEKQPPAEKKAKKKKRNRKRIKDQLKQEKKQQKQEKNKNKLSIAFFIVAGALLIGFVAWAIYFFPLLISGSLVASGGCLAPLLAFIVGFGGIFFSLVLLAGVVILTIFAIIIINRNKNGRVKKSNNGSTDPNQPEEKDFIKIQILDKASKDFPNLAPETLEQYVTIKNSIVELKYERSKLNSDSTGRRVQGKIDSIDRSITTKEAVINAIEKTHADLEPIPSHKRLPYTNIKIKLAKLELKQAQYQQDDDFRAIAKLRAVEKAIKEQEEELKLLLGIYRD